MPTNKLHGIYFDFMGGRCADSRSITALQRLVLDAQLRTNRQDVGMFTKEELLESEALGNRAMVSRMPAPMMCTVIDALMDRANDLREGSVVVCQEAKELDMIALTLHNYISVDVESRVLVEDEEGRNL